MPGWRFFSAPNRPPALVSVTSYERYGLRLALSVQYCTGGTSPVSDKAHFRPVPIGGTDGSASTFFAAWPCLAAFNTTSYTDNVQSIIRGLLRDHTRTIRSSIPT